jgi:molybdate transport system substrate-binding protein
VARSIVGLAVRAGASKPDIGSVEALRRALLAARSIAYSDGPSGAYVAALLTKLGIAEAVAAKVKLTGGPWPNW